MLIFVVKYYIIRTTGYCSRKNKKERIIQNSVEKIASDPKYGEFMMLETICVRVI